LIGQTGLTKRAEDQSSVRSFLLVLDLQPAPGEVTKKRPAIGDGASFAAQHSVVLISLGSQLLY